MRSFAEEDRNQRRSPERVGVGAPGAFVFVSICAVSLFALSLYCFASRRHLRAAAEVDGGLVAGCRDLHVALRAEEVGDGGAARGDGAVDEALGGDAADLGPLRVVAYAAPDAEEGLVAGGALPLDGDGAVGVGVCGDFGGGLGVAGGGGLGWRRDGRGLIDRVGVGLGVGIGLDEPQGVGAEVGHGVDEGALAERGVLGGDACGLNGVVVGACVLDGVVERGGLRGGEPDGGRRGLPRGDALLEPLDAVVDLIREDGHMDTPCLEDAVPERSGIRHTVEIGATRSGVEPACQKSCWIPRPFLSTSTIGCPAHDRTTGI